jgi:glycosyltransferase involved in cell wall biosynthesis
VRIAYLGQMADVATENGISKKLRAQMVAWNAAGHTTRYFSLVPTTAVWAGFAPVETELVARRGPARRLVQSFELARRIRAWQPDVIYFRYAYHSPGLPALFGDIPTVGEINSDDAAEYGLTLDPVRVAYHRLTRARILRPMAAFVCVTRELATRFSVWQRTSIVIANGVPLDRFPTLPAPPTAAPTRLVFLGTAGSPWHGVERVAELARLLPTVEFDIVGLDATAWHAQAGGRAPSSNVHLHGPLTRAAYEPLLARATAAIGSLALFKNGMNEACPLKSREYFALGLPVLAAYEDTDVPADADYYLRLPNDAAPLMPHCDQLREWLASWRGRRVPRIAIAHLDSNVKEQTRLHFMAQIAASYARQ